MKKILSILTILVFTLLSCQDNKSKEIPAEQKAQAEIAENNIALVKKLLQEGDNNNVDFLDEICSPEYAYYFPSNGEALSKDQHKEFWKAVNTAFPDLKHNIQDINAVDNMVIVRATVSGTHSGDFTGLPPTGNTVEIGQIFICRFENSKLVELREEADLLGLYQKLGMELRVKE
ncbi:ester cyclase [Lentiprolixibacter aurantiacus]|uniref:Ester cyclase n=1 Tax=Lentiprolixibacter aurantiacus TaxID=2993939 RepID=A0AAE3SN41_9FLAO|nr:ester cyclase [Lentiprolixibacter aurantiacus]MCX2718022.1 ester cyclase [Lentiprolixibacter aurantiacus]